MVETRAFAAAERHQLDESDVPVAFESEAGEVDHVTVVVAGDDDGIELDRAEPRGLGGFDPGPDLFEGAAAHDLGDVFWVEGVEVHVDAPEAGTAEPRRQFRQQDPVCRHGDVHDSRNARDALDDFEQVGSQRWLAAGQPDLAEADARRGRHDALDLLGAEGVGRGCVRRAGLRHAVDAAQITAVGEGNPEIVDLPVESIARHALALPDPVFKGAQQLALARNSGRTSISGRPGQHLRDQLGQCGLVGRVR